MKKRSSQYNFLTDRTADELKRKSLQGGVVSVLTQLTKLVLQTATLMLLARLLSPQDFGLQAMAAAFVAFVSIFSDGGLGAATIQRLEVTEDQISTLFWVNAAIGAALSALTAISAPLVVALYGEPRLYWVTVVLSLTFIFGGLAAQHRALLLREMRFATLALIDLLSLAISSGLAIAMAWLDCHYWALVAMAVAASIVSTLGAWVAMPWLPGCPRTKSGIRSMLHFGWLTTLNNVIVFFAWNLDNILLGRFWGADALGLYGRAFQLVTMPINQLNLAVSSVGFSALSRVQNDTARLARSFLASYFLLISLTTPIIIIYILFTKEIISVVLGIKWMEVVPIFRALIPAALVAVLVNPMSLLMMSMGQISRAFRIVASTTPIVILGIIAGLHWGPEGVAIGYSAAMVSISVPIIAWSKKGTNITWADFWKTTQKPLFAGVLAGAVGAIFKIALDSVLTPIPFLLIGLGLVSSIYLWTLLIMMNQIDVYRHLLSGMLRTTNE